jgi:hypothetical protein
MKIRVTDAKEIRLTQIQKLYLKVQTNNQKRNQQETIKWSREVFASAFWLLFFL